MSRGLRLALFLTAAAGLAALLGWGLAGLPDFGSYSGPYGTVLNRVAVGERHATNVVAAVVFDYRGVDTLGEELILFASAIGVALLLRETRDEDVRRDLGPAGAEGARAAALVLVPAAVLLGLAIVAHGYLTPGGGFQGGVVLASALLLVCLAGGYGPYRRLTPTPLVDLVEGAALAGFVLVGVAGLVAGSAFLENVLPLGHVGSLASAGSIAVLNGLAGIAVAAAFVLVFGEFLEQLLGERAGE